MYLETTVFNFIFAEDSPDKKQDVIKLFGEIRQGKYIPYTSDYVLQELLKAEEPKQGDIIVIGFDPQAGHKQKGRRPCLVYCLI
ncbi:MAG: type II toxin-antitoxin system PemK/MazF family toxin [Treponema sp.]|jgi:hypothetical protein|nr:type II toxin-antitoxin system PemK/MazF family toxin [Treponema sp.]